MSLPAATTAFQPAPAAQTRGHTKEDKAVDAAVLGRERVPITRTVATKVPQLADAAGGEMVVVATAPKDDVLMCWSAMVALCDSRGATVLRGMRGPLFAKALIAARADVEYVGNVAAAKHAAVAVGGIDRSPRAPTAGDEATLHAWVRPRTHEI